jgi:hypothetical protein
MLVGWLRWAYRVFTVDRVNAPTVYSLGQCKKPVPRSLGIVLVNKLLAGFFERQSKCVA